MTKEERKARRQECKAARRANRQERKAARQARKQERRQNKGKLIQVLTQKLKTLIDNELEKIHQERLHPSAADTDLFSNPKKLIAQYAMQGLQKALATGILPGFMGFATAIPEVVSQTKGQLNLIYDISMANGYEGKVEAELVLFILLDAAGKKVMGFGIIQNNELIIPKVHGNTLEQCLRLLAGFVISHLARSLICRWLPGIGTVAVMAWSHRQLMSVASSAGSNFSMDIVIDEQSSATPTVATATPAIETEQEEEGEWLRLEALVLMMKQDGVLHPAEQQLLDEMLANSDLEDSEKQQITALMQDESFGLDDVDWEYFRTHEEERDTLIIDLVAIAKADKVLHAKEKSFLQKVATETGFSQATLEILVYG